MEPDRAGIGETQEPAEDSAEDLYENAPCGYLSTLPDGTIARVNETFLRWTGYRRDELVERRRFADLLSAGGRIYHETHLAPLLRMQGAVREIALEVVCADGRRLPVLVNSLLKRDAAGDPLLIRTTLIDATERKAYERELVRARDRERAARERTEQLQRITAVLAAALAIEEIGAGIIPELVGSTGAASAVFAVRDDDGRPARGRRLLGRRRSAGRLVAGRGRPAGEARRRSRSSPPSRPSSRPAPDRGRWRRCRSW